MFELSALFVLIPQHRPFSQAGLFPFSSLHGDPFLRLTPSGAYGGTGATITFGIFLFNASGLVSAFGQ